MITESGNGCFPFFSAACISWCPKRVQRRGQSQEHLVHLSPAETEETAPDMVNFADHYRSINTK